MNYLLLGIVVCFASFVGAFLGTKAKQSDKVIPQLKKVGEVIHKVNKKPVTTEAKKQTSIVDSWLYGEEGKDNET